MSKSIELEWKEKGVEQACEGSIVSTRRYGDEASENMLIHGDNLHALSALLPKFTQTINCIYIDPPYNTGTTFEHYNDASEHGLWLSFMHQRLKLLKQLLAETGVICVQIDDHEMAYLQLLMDEVFGRHNRINTICVQMSNMSGPKIQWAKQGKRFPKIKEYILMYAADKKKYRLRIPKRRKKQWDPEYNYIIPQWSKEDYLQYIQQDEHTSSQMKQFQLVSLNKFAKQNGIDPSDEDWKFSNAYRICATKPNRALLHSAKTMSFDTPLSYIQTSTGMQKLIRTDFNRKTKTARIELIFAQSTMETFFGDIWDDIATTGGIGTEGGISFPNGKKPERLLHRILSACTAEHDWVLDAFLGSGTTVAVAHKMNRRWIGIEKGEHIYTHCIPRFDLVISGLQDGISKEVGWKGGGGFQLYSVQNSH